MKNLPPTLAHSPDTAQLSPRAATNGTSLSAGIRKAVFAAVLAVTGCNDEFVVKPPARYDPPALKPVAVAPDAEKEESAPAANPGSARRVRLRQEEGVNVRVTSDSQRLPGEETYVPPSFYADQTVPMEVQALINDLVHNPYCYYTEADNPVLRRHGIVPSRRMVAYRKFVEAGNFVNPLNTETFEEKSRQFADFARKAGYHDVADEEALIVKMYVQNQQ